MVLLPPIALPFSSLFLYSDNPCCVVCRFVCCHFEPGLKTNALRIVISVGGGRYWSNEYQKNTSKLTIICMNNRQNMHFSNNALKPLFWAFQHFR